MSGEAMDSGRAAPGASAVDTGTSRETTMFFDYTELTKRETSRMRLLGIPVYAACVICLLVMETHWRFALVIAVPWLYSFVYSKTYVAVAGRGALPPDWRFYGGVVLAQATLAAVLIVVVRN